MLLNFKCFIDTYILSSVLLIVKCFIDNLSIFLLMRLRVRLFSIFWTFSAIYCASGAAGGAGDMRPEEGARLVFQVEKI